ncbi:acyl-CoA carboxylase epsilon subunit [Phycicoccus avicenniae]|uniref:acyl-CoA carboxylase epsilon subunit n=1 Tax=Phycicoccus avicenniae TaxID=2828860 RepID=UPI003D2D6715
MTADDSQQPAIRVHGPATPEDVAAIVAVLAAAGGGGEPEPSRDPSTWASRAAATRGPLPHGPGAWHTTYRHR